MNAGDRAAEIVGRCRERVEKGEAVDPEEVIRAHPDLAATLREQFAALELLERVFACGSGPDERRLPR